MSYRERLRGDWSPARTHSTLLAVQLLTLWQAALRGLDYVGGIDAGLDADAAAPVYGWLLYASTVIVLVGLALRRGAPVILGHALLGSWYAGLGVSSLAALGALPGLIGYGGIVLGGVGVWLLLGARFGLLARVAGLAAMLGGQAVVVADLGQDYRTGTGLVVGGLLHGALALGTLVLWQRQRLSRVVDRESP